MVSDASSSKEDELFDFPARDKSGTIEQIAIYKLLKTPLKALCRDFNLRTSGNKSTLQEALIKFSLNKDMWKMLQPGHHQSHKGPRAQKPGDAKPKKLKGYRKRQQEMFGGTDMPSETVSTVENEENIELLALADALPQRCPSYYKPRPPKKELETKQRHVSNQHIIQEINTLQTSINFIASVISRDSTVAPLVNANIPASTNTNMTVPQAELPTTATPPPAPLPIPAVLFAPLYPPSSSPAPLPFSQHGPALSVMTSIGLSSVSDSSAMDNEPLNWDGNLSSLMFSNVRVQKLRLANGKVLEYTRNDVPDRPAIRFSKDIARLRRIWDDDRTDEFVAADCPLKVKGVPIALKYWNELYSHECHDKSDKRWKGYKGQWFEWKCVAEYLLARTMNEFWAEFTNPASGKRMSYTAIRKELRLRRLGRNADGDASMDVDDGGECDDDCEDD